MQIVTYSDKKTFTLTNKEFDEASVVWAGKLPYKCKRLNSSLTAFYMYAEPPAREGIKKIYLYFWDGNISRYFLNSKNKMVEILSDDSLYFPGEGEAPELKDMIPQEEYYDAYGVDYNHEKIDTFKQKLLS